MKFREVPDKVPLTVKIPASLDERIRSARGRRSLSELATAAFCEHFGIDPATYGIRASPQRNVRRGHPSPA